MHGHGLRILLPSNASPVVVTGAASGGHTTPALVRLPLRRRWEGGAAMRTAPASLQCSEEGGGVCVAGAGGGGAAGGRRVAEAHPPQRTGPTLVWDAVRCGRGGVWGTLWDTRMVRTLESVWGERGRDVLEEGGGSLEPKRLGTKNGPNQYFLL